MSLETSVSRAVFAGNGAAVDFPFSFRVWDASELLVLVTGPDGVSRDVTARCVISLSESGGTVRYAPGGEALPAGHSLVILRNMPFVQDIRLISGTRFDPAVIEEALDRAAAERQQLLEKVSRAVVVPADSENPPEELAQEIFDARDEARAEADRSRAEADRSRAEADQSAAAVRDAARESLDRASAEADRAKAEADRAGQAVTLGGGVENLEAVWRLSAPVAAGGLLDLPVGYFPGRNMLHVSCDGVELYPGPQYEESGEEGVLSMAVRMRMALPAGTVMHAWIVASNTTSQAREAAARAAAGAERAENAGDRAEAARDAAERAQNVARDNAMEATEQADRADDAAVDAARMAREVEKAGLEAREAFRCARLLSRGRGLSSLRSFSLLGDTPSGFFIINRDIVVPATAHRPLTPVENFEAIPGRDGFFLFVPPFPKCPDKADTPDREPGNTGGSAAPPAWFMPCGKRVRS